MKHVRGHLTGGEGLKNIGKKKYGASCCEVSHGDFTE